MTDEMEVVDCILRNRKSEESSLPTLRVVEYRIDGEIKMVMQEGMDDIPLELESDCHIPDNDCDIKGTMRSGIINGKYILIRKTTTKKERDDYGVLSQQEKRMYWIDLMEEEYDKSICSPTQK